MSQHSTLALEATLEYLNLHPNETVFLIAEQTFGSSINKTAHLMQQFLVERKIDIQNIKIIDRVANNTYEQLEALRLVVDNNTVTLIAFAFHAPRIKIIAKYLKLHVHILTVEELLQDNLELAKEIHKINNSPKMQKVFRMEKLFVGLAKLDKHGLIPKTYSYLFGPRAPLA